MPSGRKKGPRHVVVPEGYLTVREVAMRLGLTPHTVRNMLARGELPSIAGPFQAKGLMRFIPLSALETYEPRRRGRPPGTPDAKPRQAIHRVAPPRSRHPRQAASASNGDGALAPDSQAPAAPAPAKVWALSPDTLWETLLQLDRQKRDLLMQLRAGVPEAIADEFYVTARRLIYTELTLLEQLCGEPETKKPDTVDWFADEGEEGEDV